MPKPLPPPKDITRDSETTLPLGTLEEDPILRKADQIVAVLVEDKVQELREQLWSQLERPIVARTEQPDIWQVTVFELSPNIARHIGQANPNRMLLEMNRVGHIGDSGWETDLDIEVRVGPSQAAVSSVKTSSKVGSLWKSNLTADIWVIADTAIEVEVTELFRSGYAPGETPTKNQ